MKTPNIQRLADMGTTFDNHYIGSAPCMPARREIMTGRQEFLWRPWWQLEPFDEPLARSLRQNGVLTQMVTDHYHYWESGAHGYLEHFNGCEMIRGHEHDYWKTEPQADEPAWVEAINKHRPGEGSRYYRNVAHFKDEEDFFSPRVFQKAAEWLEANHNGENFFLQIESFDVHEPFHVPEPYRSMYTDDLNPDYTCWPPYQFDDKRKAFLSKTSLEELAYIRAQYQGKLSMVDKSLGQVWAVMDKYNLWSNTMVILTTDHGHELAEAVRSLDEINEDGRDRTLRIPWGKQHPHYLSHANIPLIVWHPDMSGSSRNDSITCTVDIYATILDALGAEIPKNSHGRSLVPLLFGEKGTRDMAYWGDFGSGICCTDGKHVLLQGWDNRKAPLYFYTAVMPTSTPDAVAGKFIPGIECPVWQLPRKTADTSFPSILYRHDDPLFDERNIIDEQPEIAEAMRKRLRELITKDGCPPEQLDRLGL